jgi:ABC-type sugar transport system ATPase subunit
MVVSIITCTHAASVYGYLHNCKNATRAGLATGVRQWPARTRSVRRDSTCSAVLRDNRRTHVVDAKLQLIAIIDAPEVGKLDEPTASLDPRAEQGIFEAVMELARGRTVLLITHRMHSVRHANRIVVLDHGEIIETGTHAELMATDGHYAQLYRLQARAFTLDDADAPAGHGSPAAGAEAQ